YLSSHYFSSRLRPPPTPTLFPYTTLFRSLFHRKRAILRPRFSAFGSSNHERMWTRRDKFKSIRFSAPIRLVSFALGQIILQRSSDRKSTRLNSSHRTISYAVFCLKKKKKT